MDRVVWNILTYDGTFNSHLDTLEKHFIDIRCTIFLCCRSSQNRVLTLPSVLSLRGEGTDGYGEAEGVTKILVPYVLVFQFPPSNVLSLQWNTKSFAQWFTISAGLNSVPFTHKWLLILRALKLPQYIRFIIKIGTRVVAALDYVEIHFSFLCSCLWVASTSIYISTRSVKKRNLFGGLRIIFFPPRMFCLFCLSVCTSFR